MDEMNKLLAAKFIRVVYYPEWLANVVMVKKANGKWRMCVDFTDLNQAYPKDSFLLPRIDQLVDSTVGHKLLTFMDAVQLDLNVRRRLGEDGLHHQSRTLLLQDHAIWIEECGSYLSKVSESNVQSTNWKKHGSLCRRYARQEQRSREPFR